MARSGAFQASPNAVKTWSSGPISTAAFQEMIVDVFIKTMSGGDSTLTNLNGATINWNITFQLSRVTPFSRLLPIGYLSFPVIYANNVPLIQGQFATWQDSIDQKDGLGSNVQVDLVGNSNNIAFSFDISVVGN